MVMRRSRAVAVVLLTLVVAGIAPAQEDLPEPAQYIWETPGTIVFPLTELLEQGVVPMTQAGAAIGKPDLVMVDLSNGDVLWSVSLPSRISAMNTTAGVLLVALHDRVAALSVADGRVGWDQELHGMLDRGGGLAPEFQQSQWFADRRRPGQGVGGAFLASHDMFYVSVGGTVYALRPSNGDVVWEQKVGFSLSTPLASVGDSIVAATLDQGMGAVSAESGDILWTLGLKHVSWLFVLEDELYCANTDGLYRIDPESGDIVWQQPLPADRAQVILPAGDRLVVQRTGDVTVLDRADGSQLGQFNTLRLGATVVDGKIVYCGAGNNKSIACVSVEDLEVLWTTEPAMLPTRLCPVEDAVVGIAPLSVAGYDLATGDTLWRYQPRPGRLFNAETWAAGNGSFFFHDSDLALGCGARSGGWTLNLPGHFFFVHWMQVLNDTLYLHSGKPNEESLGAIPLVTDAN